MRCFNAGVETNKYLVLGHLIKTMMFIGDTGYIGFFWILFGFCLDFSFFIETFLENVSIPSFYRTRIDVLNVVACIYVRTNSF